MTIAAALQDELKQIASELGIIATGTKGDLAEELNRLAIGPWLPGVSEPSPKPHFLAAFAHFTPAEIGKPWMALAGPAGMTLIDLPCLTVFCQPTAFEELMDTGKSVACVHDLQCRLSLQMEWSWLLPLQLGSPLIVGSTPTCYEGCQTDCRKSADHCCGYICWLPGLMPQPCWGTQMQPRMQPCRSWNRLALRSHLPRSLTELRTAALQ